MKKKISLNVAITDNIVEKITWQATDFQNNSEVQAKAFMLSVWDEKNKNTLKVDLWTKEMTIDEMKLFFYETLLSMSESFLKATGEKNIVEDLRDYCDHFAEKMELKKNK